MGHSFGLLGFALSSVRLDVRSSGPFKSIGRFSVLVLGLAVAAIFLTSRAAAQATTPSPSGESDVQLLNPQGQARQHRRQL